MSEHESHLVITFVGATHVLAMNEEDELDEASIAGFNTDAMSLFCGSLDNDHIIQACHDSVLHLVPPLPHTCHHTRALKVCPCV
jgi:hypothetical protein